MIKSIVKVKPAFFAGRMALLFVEMCAFYFMGTAIHEEFHMLMGNLLGVEGHVVFNFGTAFYYWQRPDNMVTIQLVRFAGGLGSGLVFFLLYLIFNLRHKETGHYQMEMFTCLTISIWQVVYGLTEMLSPELDYTIGSLIGLACGYILAFSYTWFIKKREIFV